VPLVERERTEPPRTVILHAQTAQRGAVRECKAQDRPFEEEGERKAAKQRQRSLIFPGSNVGLGNFMFMPSSVSIMRRDTARFRYHFLFAGMMYQGACFVEHFVSASSYASWYSAQCRRSEKSEGVSFQCLVSSSIRDWRRFSCSSLLMWRKNFKI